MNYERVGNDIIVYPKEGQKHTHTLIFMHGLGDNPYGWSSEFTGYDSFVTPTTKVVLLCAPTAYVTVFQMESTSWFNIVKALDSDDAIDPNELVNNANKVMEVVKKEAAELNNDFSKIFVGGFSQGASMALHIGLNFPEVLGGVIAFSGACFSISKKEDNLKKGLNIFMGHGTSDNVIPFKAASLSYKDLIKYNTVHFYNYKNMMHSTCEKEMSDVKNFYASCAK